MIKKFLAIFTTEIFTSIFISIIIIITTSVSQPMDQGVIKCLKAHYRKRLVKLILRSLDSNKPLPKVSLSKALQLLVSAWNEVSQTTIINCFKKAKILEKDQTIAINDEDHPFK